MFETLFILFILILCLVFIVISYCLGSKGINCVDTNITMLDDNHRIVLDKEMFVSPEGKLKKSYPNRKSYQEKINNVWITHNLNGPAVIDYNPDTGDIISEQYYVNGELCENELQYLTAIGTFQKED